MAKNSAENRSTVRVRAIAITIGVFLVVINIDQILNEIGPILLGSKLPYFDAGIGPALSLVIMVILASIMVRAITTLRRDMRDHSKNLADAESELTPEHIETENANEDVIESEEPALA